MIVKYEKIKDKISPIKLKSFNCNLLSSYKVFSPYILTANKVGKDNKKDIFAELTLSYPNKRDADIVIPDLLTPGISDIVCIIPKNKLDRKLKLFSIFFSVLNLSLMYKIIPKIIVVQPIILKVLRLSITLYFIRK